MGYGNQIYGTSQYGEEPTTEKPSESYTPDLMKYLPQTYKRKGVLHTILNILGEQIGLLHQFIEEVRDQPCVEHATWGLGDWEQVLGLQTDPSKSYERRREIIKAKLRGTGTTTKEMIERVASTFSGGDVQIIQYPARYHFEVRFIGIKGIPPNMAGFIQMLEDIKPAHLSYEFSYTYAQWDSIRNLTWNQVKKKSWNEIKVYEGK
ncbi:hypothetical protein BVG16_13830 [Paenibacillus selenitireducens]|uniref:Phage portal protein n=1 Tax=Paenibacillus selenitireducens TaxID=1324314 RepID=A0A1T2XCW2_9BACL|nr:YmfQ family protein [Paenibacillus selenitireducens]OPA77526.1 hypothetical protein BVG16_13830 [Paenibacillus selenitireducens]